MQKWSLVRIEGPRAGFDLSDEVIGRDIDQEVDQALEACGIAIGQQPCLCLVSANRSGYFFWQDFMHMSYSVLHVFAE